MRVLLRRYAATISVALLTAAVVATPPVAAHITPKVKHTWKHLQPLADARYQLKGTPVTWSSIQGIPAGFADNTDNEGTTGPATDLNCTGCVGTADLADNAVTSAKIADGTVQAGDLAFDPATQGELDAHKASGDHDNRYWKLDGNALTGTEFLGSTNNQALNFRVNNQRVLRLEPQPASPNIIGGFSGNTVGAGVQAATISGGGVSGNINQVTDNNGTIGGGQGNQTGDANAEVTDADFATVAGGVDNTASDFRATVGGGAANTASGINATVGGGNANTASGSNATVSGGAGNTAIHVQTTVGGGTANDATGGSATVGGGVDNTASGGGATVSGGLGNIASGFASFAAGAFATADDDGAFVWSDSCGNTFGSATCPSSAAFLPFTSTARDEFSAQATGGVRFVTAVDAANTPTAGVTLAPGASAWGVISDRATKENVAPVDGGVILDRLSSIPMATWNWKTQDESIRHIGPMAQDFHSAFGLGENQRTISTVDADGVALAAIQGLNDKLTSLEERVAGPTRSNGGSSALVIWQVLVVLGLAFGIALGGRGVRRPAAL